MGPAGADRDAGDLWLANTDGANVRRLTSHPGQELFARFSPDGRHIAFTGQYDGGEQVYVVPATEITKLLRGAEGQR